MDVAAHVEQAHREAVDLQPFAAGAIENDAFRLDDGLDESLFCARREAREDFRQIAERALAEPRV
jgi:predicted pyridoxine 5'-phosphate oxidase superfamily flavin-nucleotide-binding protein